MVETRHREVRLAAMFKALGDPTRLRIFEMLRACECPVSLDEDGFVRPISGPTVGEVCCQVTGAERITPNVSFHLKELRHAGLIVTERRGRHTICAVDPRAIELLTEFLSPEECAQVATGCCAR